MNIRLSPKHKFIALLVGFIIFWVLAYFISGTKSLELFITNKQLESKIAILETKLNEGKVIEKEMLNLEDRYNLELAIRDSIDIHILNLISEILDKNRVVLVQYERLSIESFKEGDIYTFLILLKGDYISLVKSVDIVEEKFNIGRLSSLDFKLDKDGKSVKCDFFLQVIVTDNKLMK